MRDVKHGPPDLPFPPLEQNAKSVQAYEAAGLDFTVYWDNAVMTFPRSSGPSRQRLATRICK